MEHFENRVLRWAETQPQIRTIIVVGSQARQDFPADAWSDLDLMVFATDFSAYFAIDNWVHELGDVWVSVPLQPPIDEPQCLILFAGGHKVDFHFFSTDELEVMVEMATLNEVYQRGYYPLVDKDGMASRLPPCPFKSPAYPQPSAEEFQATIHLFWYGVVSTAKAIRRRDLWSVKMSDQILKRDLLKILEWHARAINGWEYDTWHNGRFLLEWTDSQTRQSLNEIFAHFDAADSWRALLTMIALFRRLGREAAEKLNYSYPTALDDNITRYLNHLYTEDNL
jgi:aminoglycoside 6-adenylyltransferase